VDLNLINYAPWNGIENREGVGLLTLIAMVKPGHLEEILELEDDGEFRQEILHCKFFMEVTLLEAINSAGCRIDAKCNAGS
jgi:hypothetical protein